MATLLLLPAIAWIVAALLWERSRRSRLEELSDALSTIGDFTPSRQLLSSDGLSGMALDDGRQLLCLLQYLTLDAEEYDLDPPHRWRRDEHHGNVAVRTIAFSQLISCEIREDALRVAEADEVGGELFTFNVGLRRLSRRRRSADTVQHLELRLVIDDVVRPAHAVPLWTTTAKRSSPRYLQALETARRWSTICDVILRRCKAESGAATVNARDGSDASLVAPGVSRAGASP